MSYPASQISLSDSLSAVDSSANKVSQRAAELRDASLAGPTVRQNYTRYLSLLDSAITGWNDAIALGADMEAYVRDQKKDPTLNPLTEWAAMVTAAEAVRDEIFDTFPTQAINETFNVDGSRNVLTFTSPALSTFRTLADALIATIT